MPTFLMKHLLPTAILVHKGVRVGALDRTEEEDQATAVAASVSASG